MGKIEVGQYSGRLYEGGCTTHSDVGAGYKTIKLKLVSVFLAVLFNLSNSSLKLKSRALRPQTGENPYESLKLRGYIAILDMEKNVKIVFYGNGFIDEEKNIDTFERLKDSLLTAIKSCEIVTT